MYSFLATKRFRKQRSDLDNATKQKVKDALKELKTDPLTPRPNADVKHLQNMIPKKYRLRVGSYRIFYHVDGADIKLLKIADRKTAYKR
ncbi:type II toxin-antitoxin system RelE family toxin [Methanogenium marinum]|uniref:type II toxin-antitoxin system RelE family toxin n=1 Tax=Methanogenium marinum TaxID=348610 RepID=UPI003B8462B5